MRELRASAARCGRERGLGADPGALPPACVCGAHPQDVVREAWDLRGVSTELALEVVVVVYNRIPPVWAALSQY